MATLVTMAQAKLQLRIPTDESDADISMKLDQAEAIVINKCNSTAWWRAVTPTWTAATVPRGVHAAILIVLTHLYEHRGDDMGMDEKLWEAVDRLIVAFRDPVIS